MLTGEATEVVTRLGHDGLKTFGVGRDRDKRAWQGTIRQLFAAGALAETEGEFAGFQLTERGEAILFGRERIALRPLPPEATGRRSSRDGPRPNRLAGLDDAAQRLFEVLRTVRSGFAKAEGVAAFMVFPDRTLIEMATSRPKNAAELRAVQGVGDRKLVRYGPAFLAVIAEDG